MRVEMQAPQFGFCQAHYTRNLITDGNFFKSIIP